MDVAPESSSETARTSVFARNALLFRLLLVVLPVMAFDCGAQLMRETGSASDFRNRHAYYHHGLLPNQHASSAWGTGEPYPIFTNSLGMVDRAIRDVPLETDKHRIVFIGDSYTEGLGVPFEDTFVGRISARIDADRVEVLNAAAISYSPKLYYLKTKYLIEKVGLQFDELYVFLDISDIQDEILYQDFVPTEPAPRVKIRRSTHRFLAKHSFAYSSVNRLLRRQEIERREQKYKAEGHPPSLNYFWRDDINEEAFSDPDFALIRGLWTLSPRLIQNKWTMRGVELAREHMAALLALCREHGVRVTIAVYPWTPQVEKRDIQSVQVWIWKNFASKHDVGFIDLFPSLITELPYPEFDARYILPGDEHWNAAGHELVAGALWPHVAKNIEVERSRDQSSNDSSAPPSMLATLRAREAIADSQTRLDHLADAPTRMRVAPDRNRDTEGGHGPSR